MIKRKVVVIGLDGVPFQLIRNWAEEGILPNLAALMDRGISGPLQSTTPPTSAPSWSSFITGMNPGKTGIYDFLCRREGEYQFPPVNSRMRHGRPIWSIIGDAGGRVGVVNIPMSYPVDRVNGFMISGWMTPHGAGDYLYPREMADELNSVVGNYRIYPTETFSESKRESFFKASYGLMEMRTKANLHLLKKDTDFFMTVYFDTDRILHQLWHYLDPGHPWRTPGNGKDLSGEVKAYFHKLDENIGRLLAEVKEDDVVMIMSDHGMGAAHRFVVMNNWLLSSGYIRLKRGALSMVKKSLFNLGFTLRNIHIIVDKLGMAKYAEYKANYFVDHILKKVFLSFNDVDWTRTKAYSFGRMLGSIYLNVKGREPMGMVEPGEEYHQVRDEIVASLEEFRDPRTGEKMIGRIALREELYQGGHFEKAPDIMVWPADPTNIFFGLTDFGAARLIAPVYRYSGMHRDEGMLIAAGPGVKKGMPVIGAGITDLAPTILHIMGVPVPRDMDGRILGEVFEPDFLEEQPVVHAAGSSGGLAGISKGYSPKEEQEIMDRLADLGYLG